MKNKRNLANRIYRAKTIKRMETKIKLLGINCHYDVMKLLNIRLFLTIILFITLFIYTRLGAIWSPIITIIFYYGYEKVILDYPIKKRAKKLENEAIFFFEVLELSIESGNDLKKALTITTNNIDNELSLEFKKTLGEMNKGKSFSESIKAMKERIPSSNIRNLLLNMVETSTFGSNISESIQNQISYLKDKQLYEIKAIMNKLPMKISVISVLFFLPILLLFVLSPVLIEFLSR